MSFETAIQAGTLISVVVGLVIAIRTYKRQLIPYGQDKPTKANPAWKVDVSWCAEPILGRVPLAAVRRP